MTQRTFSAAGLLVLMTVMIPAALLAKPPEATIMAHTGAVIDVAFSRDGSRLASAGYDGTLKLWDIATKKQIFSYDGIRSSGNDVRFTPDGKNIVVFGSDNNVVVIDAATGKLVRSIPLADMPGGGTALDVSPDGALVAVVGRSKLRILDLATGAARAQYAVHAGYSVAAVAFSADGALIATAGGDHTAVVTDAASGKALHTLKISLNGVAVALSPDGKTLFTSTSDQVLQCFDLATGTAKTLVDKNVPIFKLAVSKDGKTLVLAGPGHGPWLLSLPDGARADGGFDSDESIKSAAISPDSRWLAGGGHDGSLFLWKNGN